MAIWNSLFIYALSFHHITNSAAITLNSRENNINCSSNSNCNNRDIICTNTASECIIHCGPNDCTGSTFYLAANDTNHVFCNGDNSCSNSVFYCGEPIDNGTYDGPNGYDISYFTGNITNCSFDLIGEATQSTMIKCSGSIEFCSVNVQGDNDETQQEIPFDFSCELRLNPSKCSLDCQQGESCINSDFECQAGFCSCNGSYCDDLNYIQLQSRYTLQPTSQPTPQPTSPPITSNGNTIDLGTPTTAPTTAPTINTTIPVMLDGDNRGFDFTELKIGTQISIAFVCLVVLGLIFCAIYCVTAEMKSRRRDDTKIKPMARQQRVNSKIRKYNHVKAHRARIQSAEAFTSDPDDDTEFNVYNNNNKKGSYHGVLGASVDIDAQSARQSIHNAILDVESGVPMHNGKGNPKMISNNNRIRQNHHHNNNLTVVRMVEQPNKLALIPQHIHETSSIDVDEIEISAVTHTPETMIKKDSFRILSPSARNSMARLSPRPLTPVTVTRSEVTMEEEIEEKAKFAPSTTDGGGEDLGEDMKSIKSRSKKGSNSSMYSGHMPTKPTPTPTPTPRDGDDDNKEAHIPPPPKGYVPPGPLESEKTEDIQSIASGGKTEIEEKAITIDGNPDITTMPQIPLTPDWKSKKSMETTSQEMDTTSIPPPPSPSRSKKKKHVHYKGVNTLMSNDSIPPPPPSPIRSLITDTAISAPSGNDNDANDESKMNDSPYGSQDTKNTPIIKQHYVDDTKLTISIMKVDDDHDNESKRNKDKNENGVSMDQILHVVNISSTQKSNKSIMSIPTVLSDPSARKEEKSSDLTREPSLHSTTLTHD